MHVTVAAWIGSANAGDELIFAALRRKLLARGAHITAVSTAPVDTASPDVTAIAHTALPALVRAVGNSDAVVFGGGGLLQDQTSGFNLPYHLSRIALARALSTPVAVVGIGAGPLRTRAGRAQVRAALHTASAISARDQSSVDLLRALGVDRVRLAADLALSLPAPRDAPEDVICACLRPWRAARGRLPVFTRARVDVTPERLVDRLAAGLDDAAARCGLPVRLVALQRGWDDLLHARVADRMRGPVSLVTPAVDEVLPVLAASRVVVAMRYHAGIAAVLAGRPAVLIGYDPKLDGLATALGAAGALLPWDAASLGRIGPAVCDVLPHASLVPPALAALRVREQVNDAVLDELLATASA